MIVKDALTSAQARQAFYCDKGREEVNLKVSDLVLVHREFLITPEARDRPSNKLRPKWFGPFKITEKVSTNCIPPGFAVPVKMSPYVQCVGPEKVLQEHH